MITDESVATRLAARAPRYEPLERVRGTVSLWGHGSFKHQFMVHLVRSWFSTFLQHHPDAEIDYRMYGTASAIGALYTGAGNLAILGEEISPAADRAFRRARGYPPTGVQIATGSMQTNFFDYAHMIFVHRDNPIRGLSAAELEAIFGTERLRCHANARVWGDLGLTGPWANRPIHPYGWQTDVDFGLFFSERILGNSHRWKTSIREFAHTVGPDGTQYDHGQQILDALAIDPGGVAISNIRYQNAHVRVVPLSWEACGPYVAPTVDSLVNQTYPLTRIIPAYVDRDPTRPFPAVLREFLRLILSREGQSALIAHSGYLPLGRSVRSREMRRLDRWSEQDE